MFFLLKKKKSVTFCMVIEKISRNEKVRIFHFFFSFSGFESNKMRLDFKVILCFLSLICSVPDLNFNYSCPLMYLFFFSQL